MRFDRSLHFPIISGYKLYRNSRNYYPRKDVTLRYRLPDAKTHIANNDKMVYDVTNIIA